MRQVHFHVQLTSATGEGSFPSGHELATALAGVIERACDILSCDDHVLAAKPVFQLASHMVDCAQKWLTQLSSDCGEIPTVRFIIFFLSFFYRIPKLCNNIGVDFSGPVSKWSEQF